MTILYRCIITATMIDINLNHLLHVLIIIIIICICNSKSLFLYTWLCNKPRQDIAMGQQEGI